MRATAILVMGATLAIGGACSGEEPAAPKPAPNPQIAALGDGQAVKLKINGTPPTGRNYCVRMPYDPVNKVGILYGASHDPARWLKHLQNELLVFDASTATWTQLTPTDSLNLPTRLTEFGVVVPKEGMLRPPGVGHTYSLNCFDEQIGKFGSLRGGTPEWLRGWPKPQEVEKMKADAKAGGLEDPEKARRCLPWLFDVKTKAWSLACPAEGDTPCHARAEAACYDPKHKRVLYWSTDGDVANRKDGVYAYDGAANKWTFSVTKGGPAPGIEQLCCWDGVNERVLYFSGSYVNAKPRQAKSFDYPSLTWTDLNAGNWPDAPNSDPANKTKRVFCAFQDTLVFEPSAGVAIIFSSDGNVHPYDVRTNAFLPAHKIEGITKGQLKGYYDPDQRAIILAGVNCEDYRPMETWAYRYKRAEEKKP